MRMKKWFILLCGLAAMACSQQAAPSEPAAAKKAITEQNPKLYEEHYPDGALKIRGMMRGNKRIGEWKSYYPNGYRWSEVSYVDGYREGLTVTYYRNGIMRYEGNYYNDERNGVWTFYDTTGVVLKRIDMDVTSEMPDSLLYDHSKKR